jgi:DNA-binding protein HU-beta
VSNPMYKRDLINEISEEIGVAKAQVARVIDAMPGAIVRSLRRGQPVVITGFGSFSTVTRAARTGRNPMTGAEIQIPETRGVKFKPSGFIRGLLAPSKSGE